MNIKKKKTIVIIIIITLLLCCIPIKYTYKDGGTVSYKAILYSYTKYHKLQENDAYYDATEFLLFPFNFLS